MIAPQYPPDEILTKVLEEVCTWVGNRESEALVLAAPQALNLPDHGDRGSCSLVQQTPTRTRGVLDGDFIFGMDEDGYIIVRPRRPCTGWPALRTKDPRPMRLHRWLAQVPHHLITRHQCDEPSCIARTHLSAGTILDNQHDRRRLRRRPERAEHVPAVGSRTRPPTPLRLPALSSCHPVSRADALFCVAGFHSPSKKARLAMRLG